MGLSPVQIIMEWEIPASQIQIIFKGISFNNDRVNCNLQTHCEYNDITNTCNDICHGVQVTNCVNNNETRGMCRVNCGLCEYDDGSPTNPVCLVTNCSEFDNDIDNCPENVCNRIIQNNGNRCMTKNCSDLNQYSCGLLRNYDNSFMYI